MYTLDSVLKLSYQTSSELWQKKLYPSNLENKLIYAFKNKLFVDAEIKVQDHIFKAHKCILAFYSTVFQKIFFNEESPSLCVMDDIDPGGFKTLLRTIYHSTVPPSCSVRSILYACDAAEKLDMARIKEELVNAFMERFPSKPRAMKAFWTLLEISQSLKLYEVKEALLKYALKNSEDVLTSESILTAKSDTIKFLLSKLNVLDSVKLETIARWCARNSKIPTEEKSRKELLSCVNFRKLTPKELHHIVSKHENFIDMKDAFDILMHIVEPTACCLPSWCTAKLVNSDKLLDLLKDMPTSKFSGTIKPRSLRECFVKMFQKGAFVDVSIYDSAKQTSCRVHSLILALGSPVLARMLYGPFANNVIYAQANSQDLNRMVWCFYELDVTVDGCWLSILQTFDSAWKYGCRTLQKKCKKKLRSTTLTTSTFWMLMDKAAQVRNSPINTKTLIQYGQLNVEGILLNYKFFNASKNSVKQILECSCLNANENSILNSVAAWLGKNCKDSTTSESKIELLKYIRFENLSDKEFYTIIKKYDKILSSKDALDILSHLTNKSENSLPKWCYAGPLRGLYYERNAKIGTTDLIEKGKTLAYGTSFAAKYIAKLTKANNESDIQYLELTWRVKAPKKEKFINEKCSILITFRSYNKTLSFVDVDMQKHQRFMIPVFLQIKEKNPLVRFDIDVKMSTCHKLSFPKQHTLNFKNMKLMAHTGIHCISDAIVDGRTSEQFQVPKYLLRRFPHQITTTEKWCK